MAKIGREQYEENYNNRLPTNNNKLIKAADHRDVMEDTKDSFFNLTDDDFTAINVVFGDVKTDFKNYILSVLPPPCLFYVDVTWRVFKPRGTEDNASTSISTNYPGVIVQDVASSDRSNMTFPSINEAFGFTEYHVEGEDLSYTNVGFFGPVANNLTDTGCSIGSLDVNRNASILAGTLFTIRYKFFGGIKQDVKCLIDL